MSFNHPQHSLFRLSITTNLGHPINTHSVFKRMSFWCCILSCFQLTAQIPLVPYRIGQAWGYADTTGRLKIKPFTNHMPHSFNEQGYALFHNGKGVYGLIDTSGKCLVPQKYQSIDVKHPYLIMARFTQVPFYRAIYKDKDTGHLYYINGTRLFKFPVKAYHFNSALSNRLLILKNDTLQLYAVNWQTRKVSLLKKFPKALFESFTFDELTSKHVIGFSLQYDAQNDESSIKKYDINGKPFRIPPLQKAANQQQEEKMEVGIADDWAPMMSETIKPNRIITKIGDKYTLSIKANDTSAAYFDLILPVEKQSQYFYCQLNGKWGIMDINGKVVVTPHWDAIQPCVFINHNSEMMVGIGNFLYHQWIVKEAGKVGIISENPDFNIPIAYDSIIPENYWHYLVKNNGLWGAIDSRGKTEIPCVVNLDYTTCTELPLLAMNHNIVIVGKTQEGFQLYSNQVLPNLETYDEVQPNSRYNNSYLTLTRKGLKGKVFATNDLYRVIPSRYQFCYAYSGLFFNKVLYTLVRLPDGQEGYVREDGKEFFEP